MLSTATTETSGDAFLIRPARARDAPGMRACARAAYAHYVARIGREPGPMVDDYARVAALPMASVMVRADDDGESVVGLVVLLEHADGLLLDNVAVLPGLSGRGLGRRLLVHAERIARNAGHDHLVLYTHALMHENLAMYARLGYVEYARREEHGFDRVYMRKRLRD